MIQRRIRTNVVDDIVLLEVVEETIGDFGGESLVESMGIGREIYRFRRNAPS